MNVPDPIDTFVLAGQSNMQGRARQVMVEPANSKLWVFESSGRWSIAQEPLHRVWESPMPAVVRIFRNTLKTPNHELELARRIERDMAHGVGPGWSFGQTLISTLDRPIGLVPMAVGDTSLDQWTRSFARRQDESLYAAMLERIKQAGGRLQAILWYQGESDAMDIRSSKSYGHRIRDWIAAVRSDLCRPDLPILIVQLGRWVDGTPECANQWDLVRHSQYSLPDDIRNTALTSAVDLGMTDPIHLNTSAQRRLGRRLARLALSVCYDYPYQQGPRLMHAVAGSKMWRHERVGIVRLTFGGVTGQIHPRDHLSGFVCLNTSGNPATNNPIYNVSVDDTEDSTIVVVTRRPLRGGESIAYGYGCNPYCNVVDSADMPVCAFVWRRM